jgi:transposase
MPKHLAARPALDETEARQVRKLAQSAHAPADWIFHAKLVIRRWQGERTRQIAQELSCNPQTVRERLHAFNDQGVDGLGMKPGSGRKPRLTEEERSVILAVVKRPPPGKATYEVTGELAAPDREGAAEWTLDTLTAAAQERGIQVARSQVRRIVRREGVRWRRSRLWAMSKDPDVVAKGPRSSRSTRSRPQARRSSASTSSAR